MNDKINLIELKDTIQDCNINFLIGAGMSAPFCQILGNIEQMLTDIENKDGISVEQIQIVRASLYKRFFVGVIAKNLDIIGDTTESKEVLDNFKSFLKIVNSILLSRKSTILSKQINLFTTNIDIFFEKALEAANVEYNDGFCGRFKPIFDTGNFKKSYFKKSLHYDNTSELPVFNLMKLHGSLTWARDFTSEDILFSTDLGLVKNINEAEITEDILIECEVDSTIDELTIAAEAKQPDPTIQNFLDEYDKLSIVNPTKEKFKDTLLNQTYYELLRIFSNELEKENTVLFVMGFSFADEHIRKLAVRAANSNPTLKIYIFAHSSTTKVAIETEIDKSKPNNRNIKVLSPEDLQSSEGEDEEEIKFNLQTINERIFEYILEMIGREEHNTEIKINRASNDE